MNRKQAIKDFKDRKVGRGIFAVRCNANGQVWVGSSPNLDAWRNSLWFSLRSNGYPNKGLQQAWNTLGEPAFQFEILEQLEDDVSALAVSDLLKEKKHHWIEHLSGQPLS
jgi:hypothetical protein